MPSPIHQVLFMPVARFVPTDLGASVLKAWWDASDAAQITASSGAVSAFADKSGNGNTISQGTAASKPTTGANTLNGLNVLTFDGGDYLQRTTTLDIPQPPCFVVCVRKYTSGTGGGLVRSSSNFAVTDGDVFTLGRDGGFSGAWGDRFNAAALTAASFSDSDNTNWHIGSGRFATGDREVYLDGLSKNINSFGVTVDTLNQVEMGLCASEDRSQARFLTGQIAEAFVIAGSTLLNMQKVEGYTAWKWGLQTSLDVSHPYKNAPP